MPSFDLVHEPWLPVRLRDDTATMLNLRDMLVRAHEVRELETGSPLESIALNRFLIAVVLHALPELAVEDGWLACYAAGQFSADQLDTYFAQRAGAFDLLHPERPFYQHPEPLASSPSTVARLFSEAMSGNNPTLFSHEIDKSPVAVSLDKAARGLIAFQAFALQGGNSKPFNFSDAPLVGKAIFWMRGRSLFEALLLNAPPSYQLDAWRDDSSDATAWARPFTSTRQQKRTPLGLLDYLTWQSRRLLLVCEEGPAGVMRATRVWMSQGDKVDPMPLDEPMAAYVGSTKKGTFPLGLRKEKALWRDAQAFLGYPDSASGRAGHPPRTLEWVANSDYELGEVMARDAPMLVDVFGTASEKKGSLELYRQERLPVYLSFLRDEPGAVRRRNALAQALRFAEDQVRGPLYRACFVFSHRVRFPGHDGSPLGKQGRADVNAFVQTLGAERLFWAALEPAFFDFLADLARADDTDVVLKAWRSIVWKTLRQAFRDAAHRLGHTAHGFQARAEGEDVLNATFSTQTTQVV